MIRVMVVEDEPPIAQSIQKLTEEYSGQVQVVHIAINGKRALEYLEAHPVDLVFTDIKMPIMTGLELSRRISEAYPDIITVIVSGFQDFEFARTAIRYGVNNYLLKPVSRDAIHEVLDNVAEELAQREQESRRRAVEEAVNRGHPALDAVQQCGVALVCAGAYPLLQDELLLETRSLNEAEIERYVTQDLGRESCICVNGRSQVEWAIVFRTDEKEQLRDTADGLYRYLVETSDRSVTLAVHGQPVALKEVGEVFQSLRKALYQEVRLFRSQLLLEGEPPPAEGPVTDTAGTELIAALKSRDEEAIRQGAAAFVDALADRGARQTELMVLLERNVAGFFDRELSVKQLGDLNYELQSAVTTASSREELASELGELLAARSDSKRMESGEARDLCEKMAAHLRLHHKSGVSIPDLGKRFGISAAQLARRFKDAYGMTISEYVNHYRIELAKDMMRSNKKLMIKEIALEVGYNDQYYFSKMFKKLCGVWPTEFIQGKE